MNFCLGLRREGRDLFVLNRIERILIFVLWQKPSSYFCGGDRYRLKLLSYKLHAEDVWLASLIIQIHINANQNDALIAQAEAIANAGAPVLV
jgi:hypothetical protein